LKIGNAPVSWGIFELEGMSADLPFPRVMDEIVASGYEGTELGPWGYYPTDPSVLHEELSNRGLKLASAFCPVDLTAPTGYAEAEAQTLATARLLRALGTTEVILADRWRPSRATVAGRAGSSDEMSPSEWDAVVSGLNRLGARLADDGMKAVFHHHVATYVETEAEINRLLDLTDPSLVGLCLDTGHAAFGGANPVRLLQRWHDRVRYVHLKDVSEAVVARIPIEKIAYDGLIRAGIFCPLGSGNVDFVAIASELRAAEYVGWLIVEQDVIVGDSGQRVSSLDAARQSRAFLRTLLGT
jgi:inosose dehydratase